MSNYGLAEINPDMNFEMANEMLRNYVQASADPELRSIAIRHQLEELSQKVIALSTGRSAAFTMHTKTNEDAFMLMLAIELPEGIRFCGAEDKLYKI